MMRAMAMALVASAITAAIENVEDEARSLAEAEVAMHVARAEAAAAAGARAAAPPTANPRRLAASVGSRGGGAKAVERGRRWYLVLPAQSDSFSHPLPPA